MSSIPVREFLSHFLRNQSARSRQQDDLRLQAWPKTAGDSQLANDPHLTAQVYRHSLGALPVLKRGRIQMAMPYANWYRVTLDDGGAVIPCCRLLNDTTTHLLGTGDASMFEPDTVVLVYKPAISSHFGYIIGVLPERVLHGNDSYSDFVAQGSGVGILRMPYYSEYISQLADEGAVLDFSNSRAIDELTFDWGRTTDTGLRFHLDPFMFQVRVDEFCGIYGFYDPASSGLLRVRGYSLDIDSAAHSEVYRNDEGEHTYFRGETPYQWESVGCFAPDTDATREVEDKAVIYTGTEGKIEPMEPDAMPFFRYREYGGYLGQGRLRMQVLPPAGKVGSSEIYTYGGTDHELGVMREQVCLDGQYVLESAKGIVIAKRRVFPVPKQIRLPDDLTDEADSAANDNYKFAGHYGTADDHEVGDLTTDYELPNLLKASAILDIHSYLFNWKSLHPFVYHKGDYDVPEESELAEAEPYRPPFGNLASDMWLPEPDSTTHQVDHRYGASKYYNVMSHLSLSDDGSVILQGGQGEEIRLVGGSVEISCPGNIYLRPGQSIVMLSGDDIIQRAYNSIDITSSAADVRVKAEHNVQVIAGNGGDSNNGNGCLLLENRSSNVVHDYPQEGGEAIEGSGIILKAAHSEVVALAKDVYLRTGGGDIDAGDITIDADAGRRNIHTVSSNFYRFVSNLTRDSYGFPTVYASNTATRDETLLGTRLRVDGQLWADGDGAFNGDVRAVDGEFWSKEGKPVQTIPDRPLWTQRMAEIGTDVVEASTLQQRKYASVFSNGYYSSGHVGNSSTQKKISGSLRTEEQYGTANFRMTQSAWQAINESVGAGTAWQETDVQYQGDSSNAQQPWPGRSKWTGDTFLVMASAQYKLYDYDKGCAKDRTDSAYTERKLGELTESKPSEDYKIIPRN